MPQNDMLKRYLEAGMSFTQMTRSRAEGIVKDLVKAGELQREQTQERVDDLVERSRKNTEHLMSLIRREVSQQLSGMGLATKDDLARLEAKLSRGAGGAAKAAAAPVKKTVTAAKKVPAKKTATKKPL
jgi:polyhydroxyalkanoate synthesis regulator phasin